MRWRAAAPKQRSLAASSHTSRHSSGTVNASHAPLSVLAPINKFQPPFTLTSAHCCIRTQLRAVHGAHTTSGIATSAAAHQRGASRHHSAPHASPAATTIDCGRTNVATPSSSPATSTRRQPVPRSAAIASTHRSPVTASVINAGV